MSHLEALWKLQELDLSLDRLRGERREAEDHPDVGRVSKAIHHWEAELSRYEGELRAVRRANRQREADIQGLDGEISELVDKLYGGQGGSPKELRQLETKIEEARRRKSGLEDALLEGMEREESLVQRLGEEDERAQQGRKRLGELNQKVAADAKSLAGREGELLQERELRAREVSPDLLRLYERLRPKREGRAVARLEGDRCGGCRVDLPTALVGSCKQGRLTQCERCGRILLA